MVPVLLVFGGQAGSLCWKTLFPGVFSLPGSSLLLLGCLKAEIFVTVAVPHDGERSMSGASGINMSLGFSSALGSWREGKPAWGKCLFPRIHMGSCPPRGSSCATGVIGQRPSTVAQDNQPLSPWSWAITSWIQLFHLLVFLYLALFNSVVVINLQPPHQAPALLAASRRSKRVLAAGLALAGLGMHRKCVCLHVWLAGVSHHWVINYPLSLLTFSPPDIIQSCYKNLCFSSPRTI